MSKPSMNLQDSYLNQVRKDGGEVRIIMLDGSELSGHVRGFDNFTVVLQCHGEQHLIYKHAMAHIVSKKPFKREFHEGERREEKREDRRDDRREERKPRETPPAAAAGEEQGRPKPFNAIDLSQVKGS